MIQHVTLIAGARPNFMKIAPLIKAIQHWNAALTDTGKETTDSHAGQELQFRLVHTGQHYDKVMSQTFFDELGIPEPDVNLACGGGTQAEQTAAIMTAFEKDLIAHPTDLVIVVGDVTSTMACSIVAKKLNTRVAHVEAGIRSYDLSMPEEINRMVTDALADYFFTTTDWATDNVLKTGVAAERVHLVGNVMIDTLLANRSRFVKPAVWDELNLQERGYFVLTLHRPANVDEATHLKRLMDEIITHAEGRPIVFPIHPRTAKLFQDLGIAAPNLHVVAPMGYLEFNYLVERAFAVVTDSGGITEETTVMGVPCMTLRDNTERPETCTIGTNELIGTNPDNVAPAMKRLIEGNWKKGGIPPLWDGHTSERIVKILVEL